MRNMLKEALKSEITNTEDAQILVKAASVIRKYIFREWISEAMCEHFDEYGVVSPACLQKVCSQLVP